MTKQEFDDRFSKALKNAANSIDYENIIKKQFENIHNENREITDVEFVSRVLEISMILNTKIMKTILLELLEPTD